MAETAAAGAVLTVLSSLGLWVGGFCEGWSCPTEKTWNPDNSKEVIKGQNSEQNIRLQGGDTLVVP